MPPAVGCAPLAISRPVLREAVVDDVLALDAEGVLNHLGRAVGVVAVDLAVARLPGSSSRCASA